MRPQSENNDISENPPDENPESGGCLRMLFDGCAAGCFSCLLLWIMMLLAFLAAMILIPLLILWMIP